MATMVKTVDLRKVYRIGDERVVALGHINLEIEEGQVCCIVGTSGSGKSTLLNQLAGLEKPTKGEVAVRGRRVSKMTEKELARFRQESIGFVFQSYNLMPGMTALENVAMPLTFRGMGRRERIRRAKKMLDQVGLADRVKHTPNEMSGGQQQRVGIARAFVTNPAVVFADEPTGNLDTKTTKEIMELFLDFSRTRGTTIILVTHDRNLANYADRIVTIVDGEVVSDETNHSLYEIEKEQGTLESQQKDKGQLLNESQRQEQNQQKEQGRHPEQSQQKDESQRLEQNQQSEQSQQIGQSEQPEQSRPPEPEAQPGREAGDEQEIQLVYSPEESPLEGADPDDSPD